MSSLRTALLMNGDRGLRVFRALLRVGLPPVAVILEGDSTEVKEQLRLSESGIPSLGLNALGWNGVRDAIASLKLDLAVVAGFSRIVPSRVLDAPRLGFINLHAGPVPQYRGGSPLNWQMINGENVAGVSILRMTSGLDDGPVVDCASFSISPEDTIATLHEQAALAFHDLLIKTLLEPERILSATPQGNSGVRYWHQRSDEDGQIIPSEHSAPLALRMVRALSPPYPGAWILRDQDVIRILSAELASVPVRGTRGRVVRLPGMPPILVLKDGAISLTRTHLPAGLRELSNGDRIDCSQPNRSAT